MSVESSPNFGIIEARVSRDGPTATLALAGEFDLSVVDVVREKLADAYRDEPSRLVIDLRGLTFIDSTGISFLISTIRDDEEGRVSFIACDAPAVRRVFAVTGVAQAFGGGNGETSP